MSLPSSLGRLQRLSRIGSGGFATVWLYADPELDSRVAVKALADNWSARLDIRDRFLEEARILRRADSDHVVRVYDIGETDDGTPYFVMNYADQGTVADLLTEPERDLAGISEIVRQASLGLYRLHRMGILHRDVKPQNLLRSTDAAGGTRVMVADLGVAKAMLGATGITQVVGTPAYMAPEQADPTHGVDTRCDIHAIGAVAYHLLTGRPPRLGDVNSLLNPKPVEPASNLVESLSTQVDEVLATATAYDPGDRYESVIDFSDALRLALQPTLVNGEGPTLLRISSPAPAPLSVPVELGDDVATQAPTTPVEDPPAEAPEPAPAPVLVETAPVAPSPAAPPVATSPVPVTPEPQERTRRRRLPWVALVLLLLAAAGGWAAVNWEPWDDDPDGPTAELTGPWDERIESPSRTVYTNSDLDITMTINIEPEEGSPTTVVSRAQSSLSSSLGDYESTGNRGLIAVERGDWQTGRQMHFRATIDGEPQETWRRYLGNAEETQGWVEVTGPQIDLERAEQLLDDVVPQVMP